MWWRRTLPAAVALLAVSGLGLITVGLTADPATPPRPPADAPRRTEPAPDLVPLPRAAPVLVQITAIGVRAEVVPVGADAAGVLQVPPLDRPTLAGWYRHGVSPGETGNAVLVGHVDSPAGPAVFFDLGRLRAGEQIQVTRADTRVVTFTVDDVRAYPKEHFPTTLVYGPADAAALRLITCGGRFDATTGNYVDNVVVFATRTS
ncbi:class F sortase [Micromonospora chokoriensis]|uniref:Sortase family protein n=1 Tax=Micromonospora chokoriensis TaxID=356851 RepID=A0A1C4YG10_9ACTN|nr:class F sortase [Micromonospora chokoriensis]SCF19586.1 Sortase family protein [Micromonospora chokoriensis]